MKPTLSDEEFERLRQFIYKLCGINLGPAKRELIIARLSKRMRDLGIETFTTYQNLVAQCHLHQQDRLLPGIDAFRLSC